MHPAFWLQFNLHPEHKEIVDTVLTATQEAIMHCKTCPNPGQHTIPFSVTVGNGFSVLATGKTVIIMMPISHVADTHIELWLRQHRHGFERRQALDEKPSASTGDRYYRNRLEVPIG